MHRPEGSLISYFSNRVKQEGGINLAQGIPAFAPPSQLTAILKEIADEPLFHRYAPGIGNFQLLELVRSNLALHYPTAIDNLLIVQGATEAIFLSVFYLQKILTRPFSALSFDPVYESYPKLAEMFDIPFYYIDYDHQLAVDFVLLERTITCRQVKIIFIASPGNPLGKVWTHRELSQLVELACKHDVYIIFDAVYKDICYREPDASLSILLGERVFYVDSFSKMLSITGWRIGYLVAPREHMAKIRGIHDYTGLSAPAVLQEAIARYLAGYHFGKDYTREIKTKCAQSYDFMKKEMANLGFAVADTAGGYFIWACLPGKWNDGFEFAYELYEREKLALVPGENFSPTRKNYIRLNIAVEQPVLAEAVVRLARFLDRW